MGCMQHQENSRIRRVAPLSSFYTSLTHFFFYSHVYIRARVLICLKAPFSFCFFYPFYVCFFFSFLFFLPFFYRIRVSLSYTYLNAALFAFALVVNPKNFRRKCDAYWYISSNLSLIYVCKLLIYAIRVRFCGFITPPFFCRFIVKIYIYFFFVSKPPECTIFKRCLEYTSFVMAFGISG